MTSPRRAKRSDKSGPQKERLSSVAENYLLSLYGLWEEKVRVTLGQLTESLKRMPESEGLGTSLPSVAGMVRRMEREGLLETGASRDIRLTSEGFARAEDITRRHRLAERMVVDLLGVELPQAHLEAHRLEHAISPELLLSITERLRQPTTSPYGRPIPGSGFQPSPLPSVSLDQAEPGQTYVVERVPEDNESLVQFLVEHDILPGEHGHHRRGGSLPGRDYAPNWRPRGQPRLRGRIADTRPQELAVALISPLTLSLPATP